MIKKSDAYRAAVVGDTRHMRVKALVDIVDPDIVREGVETSPADAYSEPAEIYDRDFTSAPVKATLEPGRWLLGGETALFPDTPSELEGVKNFTSEAVCGADCTFETAQEVAVKMSNCDILQTATIAFSENEVDAFGVDFTCEVYTSTSTPAATVEITNNTERTVCIRGFTVYGPTKVLIKVTKMSKPYSKLRVVELVPGIYETWSDDDIQSISITQQAAVSMTRLPYSTCKLTAFNRDNRFSPVEEDGVFLSLQDGEPITVSIGVHMPDGSTDWVQVGVFYQKTAGWSLKSMGITVTWNMVDIIGLLANRDYIIPETIPTTVDGWLSSIVEQLGTSFASKYSAPEDIGSTAITATEDELEGATCGEILRAIGLATSTYCVADTQTGFLTLKEKTNKGNTLVDFDNMNDYPTLSGNEGCARVVFKVQTTELSGTTEKTVTKQYAYPGTNGASDTTINLDDMFLADDTARQAAVRQVVEEYGGNKLTCRWRGDPSIEAGDIVNLQLTDTVIYAARLIKQEFNFSKGIMTNLKAELIQGSGWKNYQNRTVIAESGTYIVPEGVTEIYVIIVGGGDSGYGGEYGNPLKQSDLSGIVLWGGGDTVYTTGRAADGDPGDPGEGGRVFYTTLSVTPGQTFSVSIGAGGVPTGQASPLENAEGEDTTFGTYSSASGAKYPYGFSDAAAGETLAPAGLIYWTKWASGLGASPSGKKQTAYGSGGSGGKGGTGGYRTNNPDPDYAGYVDVAPTEGQLGSPGIQGCVIIYDTEVTEE